MFENLLRRGERLAKVEANRALLRFVNGVEWLVRDPKSVVGRTPYDVVYKRDKLEVRRYHAGSVRPRFEVPVLLVPPLMVKPFIFDLFPGRSLVEFLLQRGFKVYLVDFGEPDDADAFVTLDDYVLDWMPTACRAVKEDAECSELSLVGYCMGGLFCLTHTAANDDSSVRNIVTIGAPVDANKMGLFAWMAKLTGNQLEGIAKRIGNVPGGLSSTAFRLLTPMKNVTRYADLFMNMWNHEYVNGFDAMNQWVSQFIDYPQGAFVQFNREFMQRNKLIRGALAFRGKVADLKRIKSSLLVFGGDTDQVAPLAAVEAVLGAVGSSDKEMHVVHGGHMGVFAGSTAPEQVWSPAADWLAQRSQSRRLTKPLRAAARSGRTARRRSVRAQVSAGREKGVAVRAHP
ncbi:MAG TPA: alpha/beta fold hydrolase [Candidatus Acidoferrales bacterium]|nr:alpha/beta fold hydrolase [Candidatus Acidoferrales bacterium]